MLFDHAESYSYPIKRQTPACTGYSMGLAMFTNPPRFPELFRWCPRGGSRLSARFLALLAGAVLLASSGCTGISEYIHNGFKVGPNYHKPCAPVASEWIDSHAVGVNTATVDLCGWWTAFHDPVLNNLIGQAYQQNLTLRSAGTRILAARAERGIAVGNLFPQKQQAIADYSRNQVSRNVANPIVRDILGIHIGQRAFDDWLVGGELSWELDFWGRFRRSVTAADAELDASVENYDDALVLLVSEVASTYVQIRVLQQELVYVAGNISIQSSLSKQADDRLKLGAGAKIDVGQMRSNLYDTLGLKEQLEIQLRQTNDALCVLLGIPPRDLLPELGPGEIPVAPPEVAIGMPADLLRRRPDLRRAERLVAAQSERIGIATADLYPRISLIGALGYESANFSNLFSPGSFFGTVGPNMRWDILNYGRLLNGIRVQDALFQTAAVDYQNAVLNAGREVEDALVLFLRSQVRTRQLVESAKEAQIAAEEAVTLSKDVKFDLNRAFVTSNFLVGQQDKLAQSRGDIALGFIEIYKALGGGWEIRMPECQAALTGGVNCQGPAPDNGAPAPRFLPPQSPPPSSSRGSGRAAILGPPRTEDAGANRNSQ
jgi:NodT family efflux transporter outer membrane factor (OMF) lipoprotein